MMFTSQLGRAVRATPQLSTCASHRSITASRSASTPALSSYPQRLHQRRPSSSKASCPPDDESAGAKASSTGAQQKTPQQPARTAAGRTAASKKKHGQSQSDWLASRAKASSAQDAAYKDLPRVPGTHNHSGQFHQKISLEQGPWMSNPGTKKDMLTDPIQT